MDAHYALVLGISKQRWTELTRAIEEGEIVEVYYTIGRTYDDSNRMYGKAQVLEIETSEEVIPSPEPFYTPTPWQMYKTKSWIKIRHFIDWSEVGDKVERRYGYY